MGNSHKNLCSCVVIESSFDPGERLQAPWSLWFLLAEMLKSFSFGTTILIDL
jgi:hypothetical protein